MFLAMHRDGVLIKFQSGNMPEEVLKQYATKFLTQEDWNNIYNAQQKRVRKSLVKQSLALMPIP